MEFNWELFKTKYNNEQEARQGFTSLCETVMQKQYPDYIIKNSDMITEDENAEDTTLDKKCIIFLPKYFMDGVSNSRKGQIRKALNDNLPYMKANKISQWILMMPLEFSFEEKNWWENWSLRIKQEHGITPTALLSKQIINIVSKLGINFKGMESLKEETPKDDFVEFDFDDEELQNTENNSTELPENEEITANEENTIAIISNDNNNTDSTETDNTESNNADVAPSDTIKSEDVNTIDTPNNTADTLSTDNATESETESEENTVSEAPKPDAALVENVIATARQLAQENNTQAISTTPKSTVETLDEIEKEMIDNNDNNSVSSIQTSKKQYHIQEPNLNQLKKTFKYKQQFEDLEKEKLKLPSTKDNNQRAVFDKRREDSNVKNYLNDFVFGDLSKFKGKELIKKAQIYVTNQQYSRGLYIYEYANAKKLVDNDLREDYNKGVDEADFKLRYKYQMILGDLLFAKRDYINAAETYEKARIIVEDFKEHLEKNSDGYAMESSTFSPSIRDNEAKIKELEAKAEALLQIGEFSDAVQNYELALELDPDNEQLKERCALAQYLEKGTRFSKNKWLGWLNIFVAPYYYFKARKIDPNIKELQKAEKLRRQAIWGVIATLIILAAIAFVVFVAHKAATTSHTTDNNVTANAPTTPLEIYLSKGDRYMACISAETPHYIDSAIYAYDRARRFDNTDTLAEIGYRKAMIAKHNYIEQVQQNIKNDSATYFLSMRRPTEGLRLFKYKYDTNDPSKGKFGFVDTLGNVVIAPIYDFNFRTMDEQGETFYNGRAKVCLKTADNDTIYFYIDQHGNKIEE